MFESIGQRTWLQSRGNFAGGQAYPTNSYSDGYTYSTYPLHSISHLVLLRSFCSHLVGTGMFGVL